ncbi:MAG: hypothetical protein ABR555_16690 [Pyrinomonadaceae bacterium]
MTALLPKLWRTRHPDPIGGGTTGAPLMLMAMMEGVMAIVKILHPQV